ncbi:hypothetical protein [Actinoplanes utahensis]|uniref:Uncharacterized protein n=1 Tax=Actinoplanes utahensis TaxID=1869 RepID=A0A0A6X3H4_ACTUT|nr:hypothetical protein [Actinoplanes utahensis]KHD74662.1 hypothetical protein MB27_27640 [Actinoplanes utahensis]GIF31489.1 hypothetical protein Aut01nite_44750 [Actinoplanes utahensis]
MIEQFHPALFAVAFLLWPATKSIVFVSAAAISMWSRRAERKKAAERIMRMIQPGQDQDGQGS